MQAPLPPRSHRHPLIVPLLTAALLVSSALTLVSAGEEVAGTAQGKTSQMVEKLLSAPAADQPVVLRRIIDQGPSALPALREALDSTEDPARRAPLERAIRWIRAGQIVPILEAGLETMLTFDGQYSELSRFGDEGIDALIAIVDDSSSDIAVRVAACRAIADVGDPSLLPRLRPLQSDILMPQALREQLGILLASFGDTHVIDRDLEEYQKYARNEQLQVRVSANIQLANLYYRIRDYEKAVERYEKVIEVYEDLIERQDSLNVQSPALQELREQLTIHYYNAACSNSLLGDMEKCKEYLLKAVKRDPTHFDNIEKDGDLARLRAHPGYEDFRRELGRLFEGQQL